jgi:hypothetical protein
MNEIATIEHGLITEFNPQTTVRQVKFLKDAAALAAQMERWPEVYRAAEGDRLRRETRYYARIIGYSPPQTCKAVLW